MEIIIEPETLRRELSVFQSLIVREAALLELSNIMLEAAANGKIYIYGTDGDVSLRAETAEGAAEVITAGAVCLKADKLVNMLGTLDAKVKSIRLRREENDYTSVLFGRSHFKIAGIATESYPQVNFQPKEAADENAISIPAGLLRKLIATTQFAVGTEAFKPAQTGINFKIADGALKVAATDGFRIAFTESPGAGAVNKIIPRKAAAVLTKLLTDVRETEPVAITYDANQIYMSIAEKRFAFRQIAAEYPQYELAVPQNPEYAARFNYGELRGAIRRADLFAEKNAHSPVTITLRPEGEAEITARCFEEGSGREVISAQFNGAAEKQIKLKTGYLTDYFNSLNGVPSDATLEMSFSDKQNATLWRAVNSETEGRPAEYEYRCVITRLG